jgi:hypothetical protein
MLQTKAIFGQALEALGLLGVRPHSLRFFLCYPPLVAPSSSTSTLRLSSWLPSLTLSLKMLMTGPVYLV